MLHHRDATGPIRGNSGTSPLWLFSMVLQCLVPSDHFGTMWKNSGCQTNTKKNTSHITVCLELSYCDLLGKEVLSEQIL
jgi:hypothetical protein